MHFVSESVINIVSHLNIVEVLNRLKLVSWTVVRQFMRVKLLGIWVGDVFVVFIISLTRYAHQ